MVQACGLPTSMQITKGLIICAGILNWGRISFLDDSEKILFLKKGIWEHNLCFYRGLP